MKEFWIGSGGSTPVTDDAWYDTDLKLKTEAGTIFISQTGSVSGDDKEVGIHIGERNTDGETLTFSLTPEQGGWSKGPHDTSSNSDEDKPGSGLVLFIRNTVTGLCATMAFLDTQANADSNGDASDVKIKLGKGHAGTLHFIL